MRRDSASQYCHRPSCMTLDKSLTSLSLGDLICDIHIIALRPHWWVREGAKEKCQPRAPHDNRWLPPSPGLILGGD